MPFSSPARWTLGPTAGCSPGKLEKLKQGMMLCDWLCQVYYPFRRPQPQCTEKRALISAGPFQRGQRGEGASIWLALSLLSHLPDGQDKLSGGWNAEGKPFPGDVGWVDLF